MGQTYATPTKATDTTTQVADASTPTTQPRGNAAAQEKVGAAAPLARMWSHISGKAEGADPTGTTVSRGQLRSYLDRIGLAEGEMFRGTKLDGVTDKLVETYDTDKDGKLSWAEFQGFGAQITNILSSGKGSLAEFGVADSSGDGQASLKEIQSRTAARLPKDTDHKDLIAQLGARATIDAADTNQQDQPVSKRTLSADEWTAAAKGLGGN